MSSMKAVVVDPSAPGNVRVEVVEGPTPTSGEVLVRVAATSLNRGEIRQASGGLAGRRIGWDFAGTVERAAANGTGPREGARVMGVLGTGAWAELVAAPVEAVAILPDAVTFTRAATLPVAGLTALYGLEKSPRLLGARVLITGGTGGVGHLAIQLARLAGAHVIAPVRAASGASLVRSAGAHDVIVGADGPAIASHGPYDLILDGVGGPTLSAAIANLAKDSTAVVYGATGDSVFSFEAGSFYARGGASLYGFLLFHELRRIPASGGLSRLGALVAEGKLSPLVEIEAPLSRIGEIASQLTERKFTGKAVITF